MGLNLSFRHPEGDLAARVHVVFGRTAPGRQCDSGQHPSCISGTIQCRYTYWAILWLRPDATDFLTFGAADDLGGYTGWKFFYRFLTKLLQFARFGAGRLYHSADARINALCFDARNLSFSVPQGRPRLTASFL